MAAKRAGLLAAAFTLCLCEPASAEDVLTSEGMVRGTEAGGVNAWLGIPFAAPPVGKLRWRPPQRPAAWHGVRATLSFAPACPQAGVSMPGEPAPPTDEDCLYLNVWASRDGPQKRPVMVWIHGGGYTNGATSLPLYWGDSLARRGAVVVTLSYRLGALGFLSHPELSSESGAATSGNYGLMDQIAALEWVKRNISAFGGDPGTITLFGQSAGAMSISLLMASPRARGLFHRAIAQSGGVFEPLELAPHYQLAKAELDGVQFARQLGAGSIAELRALPVDRLIDGAGHVSHPVIEPTILPRSPYDAYVSGSMADIPLIVGSNAEEARSLIDVSAVTAQTLAGDIRRAWGELPQPLIDAYPFKDDAEARQARLMFDRDLRFGWDMWAWARLHAKLSKHSVYYYRFSHRPPFPAGTERANWGAGHFAELWYMFDHLDQENYPWSADDRRLADTMAGYWVNFARRGDPNGDALPSWTPFAAGAGGLLELKDRPEMIAAPADPQLRVFDGVYDAIRGRSLGPAGKQ